jgi:hypothetical protein
MRRETAFLRSKAVKVFSEAAFMRSEANEVFSEAAYA